MWKEVEQTIEQLIGQQNKELLKLGEAHRSDATPEDMLQPNDYQVLENHPAFRYEEGVLSRSANGADGVARPQKLEAFWNLLMMVCRRSFSSRIAWLNKTAFSL